MSLRAIGIRWRLVGFIVVILLPITGLLYANAVGERSRLAESANQDILNQAKIVASAHDQLLQTVERLLVALAQDPVIRDFTDQACNEASARVTAAHPAYSNIAVSNLEGTVVCSANPAGIGSLVGDRVYYQEALTRAQLSTSGYLFGRISLRPVDVFTMPVFDEAGVLIGVLELSIDLRWLEGLIESQGLRTDVQTTLVGPDGLVLVRVPSDEVTTGSDVGGAAWLDDVVSSVGPRTLSVQEPGRPEALGAVVPLAPLSGVVPGYVMVTASESVALAGARDAFNRGLITLALVGLAGVGWVWGATTVSVHRPLRALAEAARAYSGERFSHRVRVSRASGPEMQNLAEAFNSMAESISANEDALRRAASTDALTGYPNRVEVGRLIDHRFEVSPSQPAALVKVRLRNFSGVNATFGFEGGDALLRQVAPRLARRLGVQAIVGRTDGDEFVVLVPVDLEEVRPTVDAMLRAVFDEPFQLSGEPVYLSARVSMSVYPTDGTTAVELDRRASLAMGRVRGDEVVAYDASHDEPRAGQVTLLGELHHALARGEFELFYQPKVDLNTWRVIGAEALVRWRRADGELLGPGAFIPLAEQSGYIRELSAWVLRDAASQLAAWRADGMMIHVAANISAADFEDDGLSDRLRALREEFGLDADVMDIEITESALIFDMDEAVRLSQAIRESGFTIGIDDFGTGHSGLVYLQRLPVTTLKIDRSFVIGVADDRRSRDLVAGTIDLARRFGLTIVAEGIETEEVAQALRWMGCDVGQGYYFSRPMPAADFPGWVRDFEAEHDAEEDELLDDILEFPGETPESTQATGG